MKRVYIWRVERTDKVGWDETAGIIVAAHTEAEALATKPGRVFLVDFKAG